MVPASCGSLTAAGGGPNMIDVRFIFKLETGTTVETETGRTVTNAIAGKSYSEGGEYLDKNIPTYEVGGEDGELTIPQETVIDIVSIDQRGRSDETGYVRIERADDIVAVHDEYSNRPNTLPAYRGEAPVNYLHFRDSVALSMWSEGVPKQTIEDVLLTVDDAIVQNECELEW